VPKAVEQDIRDGVNAWQVLQKRLRELAELNKDLTLERARRQPERKRQ